MKQTHLSQTCPACGSPFSVISDDSTTVVWCSVGRCPSEKANDGIKGNDPADDLAKKLIVIIEDDDEW